MVTFISFTVWVLMLLLAAGFVNGLRIGIVRLSMFDLRQAADLGEVRAKLLYPLRLKQHETNLSLLLLTIVLEVLAVTSVYGATVDHGPLMRSISILATAFLTLILVEAAPRIYIVPRAHQLAAHLAPYIEKFVAATTPLINKLAQRMNSAHVGSSTEVSGDELLNLVHNYQPSHDPTIHADIVRLMQHAIGFSDKIVHDYMTPKSVVVAVQKDDIIGPQLLGELHNSGHSRFPVYEAGSSNDIVGTLFLHDLVERTRHSGNVSNAMSPRVYFVNENQSLDHVLNAFIKTKWHMFIVVNQFAEMVGLITIEDVIEQLMGRQIVDEFDRYDDMRAVASKQAKQRQAKKSHISYQTRR